MTGVWVSTTDVSRRNSESPSTRPLAILASDGADVANVRESIGARLDRAADHNSNYPGVVRVLRMLAKRVRDGRENADL